MGQTPPKKGHFFGGGLELYMKRISAMSRAVSKYAAKSGFDTFLKIIGNPCLDPKYRPEIIRNRKSTPEIYFQATRMNYEWGISKSEKNFMHNLLAFFKLQ